MRQPPNPVPVELLRTCVGIWDMSGLGPRGTPENKMGIYGGSPRVDAQALSILHET